jgi:mono/diheme cytochrome c family protein
LRSLITSIGYKKSSANAEKPQLNAMEKTPMQAISSALLTVSTIAFGCVDFAYAQLGEVFGKEEFVNSCAPCHGVQGKGDGPVAKSLTKTPSDLTILEKKSGGVFPLAFVYDVIDGRIQAMVHGSKEMPVWGKRYKRELKSRTSRGEVSDELAALMVRARILMLTEYLYSLQQK